MLLFSYFFFLNKQVYTTFKYRCLNKTLVYYLMNLYCYITKKLNVFLSKSE